MSKVYEARVDGFLRCCGGNDERMAIVKVKLSARGPPSNAAIRVQESAPMAAWISQSPPELTKATSEIQVCPSNRTTCCPNVLTAYMWEVHS